MSDLDKHAKAGIEAINDGRLTEAISHLEQALALDADRPDLNNALGMTYLRRGDAANGLPFLKRAVVLAKPFTEAKHQEMRLHFHLGLATAQQALDLVCASEQTLVEAVRIWPQSVEPIMQLAQLNLQTGQLTEGLQHFQALKDHPNTDSEYREMTTVLVNSVQAFLDASHDGEVFLRAHQESYKQYFDDISAEQVRNGWFAEAARMKSGDDGSPQPIIAEGARPYAMERVDLVNPRDGTAAQVYSENEPMIVTVNGYEPLSQVPVVFPWKSTPFDVQVCSRCPWHWLDIFVQFVQPGSEEALIHRIDPTIGEWYLAGFNGDFGEKESGRFHYITDPELITDHAVNYRVDLGRARFEAIESLLTRLEALHITSPIDCVLFGQGKLKT